MAYRRFPYRFLEEEILSHRIYRIGGRNECEPQIDPLNGVAIGMSSAHAIPLNIFEQHKHLQMNITAMDSTMILYDGQNIRQHNLLLNIVRRNMVDLTGLPANDFFKYNKITAYGDDNVLSSNCFNDKWYDAMYFAKKVPKTEVEHDTFNNVEFLSEMLKNIALTISIKYINIIRETQQNLMTLNEILESKKTYLLE
ncbi:40_t:CDS:2 [Dentiscutata erythropus]|uniref:38_t:CDS:1 n=1 Tax=Dentiscutata erythropus TaxID=1348616 RepID=A0A9N9CNY5_9GLOM|nr:38_t:CDS:2 [Dentiscutata erythropus]CAG8605785.1 40_t:CDS:2 [Dentiscutata erythropus]